MAAHAADNPCVDQVRPYATVVARRQMRAVLSTENEYSADESVYDIVLAVV